MAYDVNAMEHLIRREAVRRNINPDVAVRVARSEGLGRGIWQSKVTKNGVREPSYGPFQMLVGGPGTGFPSGMGNAFMRDTGLDPRDPKNAPATVGYALDVAAKEGWGQWYGPKHVGIGRYDGIQGAKSAGGSYGNLPNPNERLAGDSLVPRNTHAEVEAATQQPPHDASVVASIWGAGEQPNPYGANAVGQSQGLANQGKESSWNGILGELSKFGNGPEHARMPQMGDARQSGGGLLEYLAGGGNPYANFARKQRGILG